MIYKTNPISRLGCAGPFYTYPGDLTLHYRICFPNDVLGIFQIARQNAHRLPPARAHDGYAVVATRQQVLGRTNAHRVAAEGVNCRWVQSQP